MAQVVDPLSPFEQSQNQNLPTVQQQAQQPQQVPTREQIRNTAPDNQPRRDALQRPIPYREEMPEPPTEFQQFIFSSTGYRLEIFGQNLFRDVPTTFAPMDRVPVTADYQVGPGDEILLRGWGQIDVDYHGVVDRNGNFFIPKVGNVSVAGIKYKDLQPYLKAAVGKVFHDFELNVALGQLRSIQVFVVGQAKRPGVYTVGSLSTLVNAIFASGGPSNKGSMRRIQLRRDNKVVTEFDLYDLLVKGDKSKDAPLLPGDVIFIPAVGPSVAVMGSVKVPGVYEAKDDSTLGDVLDYSGGLTPTATGDKASIERITSRTVRTIEEFLLDKEGLARRLKDGDLVTMRALSARFDNAVTLRGNVAVPGRYPWHEGIKVRDVIPDREALITRDYWLRQGDLGKDDYLQRRNNTLAEQSERLRKKQAGELRDDDKDKTSRRDDSRPTAQDDDSRRQVDTMRDQRPAEAGVAQREADAADPSRTANTRRSVGEFLLTNDIKRNAPDINWDYAVIQRLNHQNLTTQLIPFNLGKAVADPADPANLALQPGDVITIFSQADIKVPVQKQSKFVRLEGEFNAAGVYEAEPGETLRHLIARAGGLTPEAYLYGSEFTRESTREAQQKRIDQFLEQLSRDVERSSSVRSQNVGTAEEAAGLQQRAESQRKLVDKLRQVRATGRVVLALKPSDADIGSLPDFILEDGDRYVVPYQPAVVNVVGAVYNDNSFLYQPTKHANYYLHQAGGPTREADAARTFIVRADGSIISRNRASGWFGGSFESIKLMPGDTIIVPERLDKTSLLKGLRDWSQVMAQFALGVAAFKTLSP